MIRHSGFAWRVRRNHAGARLKYELTDSFSADLGDHFCFAYGVRSVSQNIGGDALLGTTGMLYVTSKYKWDGPSGPTRDTADSMLGSLVHDILYRMGREGQLRKRHRKTADRIARLLWIQEGMPKIKAWAWYIALRLFAGGSYRAK